MTWTYAQGEPSLYLSGKPHVPIVPWVPSGPARLHASLFGAVAAFALWTNLSLAQTRPEESGSTGGVHLSDRAELDRVIDLYHSGQYEACKGELLRLVGEGEQRPILTEPPALERGRLYLATCALMLGEESVARASLYEALKQNPLMAPPDSLTFPPHVVALFLQVRDEVQSLISKREQEEVERLREAHRRALAEERERKERERKLYELASQETLVTQNNRIVAFLPFGAGQYQNGQKALGDFFLVTEAGVAAIAGVSGLILFDLYRQTLSVEPAANDNSKFQAAYTVFAASSWTLVGLVAVGMLEANINFKETRVVGTRKRTIFLPSSSPKPNASASGPFDSLLVVPYGVPTESGFQLGVWGSF